MTSKKTEINTEPSSKPTSRKFLEIFLSTIDALGSFLSAVLAAFALYVGISQFNSQTKELEYEREQRVKLDRPIISIEKNLVSNFKEMKQIKLVMKNVGVRPAYSLGVTEIVLRRDNDLSPIVYNQKDYFVDFSNPIFNGQEINFINNLPLTENAEYFIKINLSYKEENNGENYHQDFYFKWKHTVDRDFIQESLYGTEREVSQKIDEFVLKNKNTEN